MIPGPEDVPECIEKIDAAIHWDYSPEYVYLFAGDWYYRFVQLQYTVGIMKYSL